MSEDILIRQGAPTLAGIKTAIYLRARAELQRKKSTAFEHNG